MEKASESVLALSKMQDYEICFSRFPKIVYKGCHIGAGDLCLDGHFLGTFWTLSVEKCPKHVQILSKICPTPKDVQIMSKRCPYSYQMSKKYPNLWTFFGHLHE